MPDSSLAVMNKAGGRHLSGVLETLAKLNCWYIDASDPAEQDSATCSWLHTPCDTLQKEIRAGVLVAVESAASACCDGVTLETQMGLTITNGILNA